MSLLDGISVTGGGSGGAAPDSSPTPAAPSSNGLLSGITIGKSAAPATASVVPTPKAVMPQPNDPVVPSPSPLMKSVAPNTKVAPPEDEGIWGNIKSGFQSALSKASDFVGNLVNQPDQNSLGTDINKNTVALLPSTIAENLPFVGPIVKQIHDDPESASYLAPKDVLDAVPEGSKQFVAGFVADPIATVAGAVLAPLFNDPQKAAININVPGLGQVTSLQYDAYQDVQNGTNPWVASLKAAPNAIFDTMFFLGMAEKVAAPRESVIMQGEAPEGSVTPLENPKSFRSYTPPTGKTPVPDNVLQKIVQEKNIDLPDNYDPKAPTYFRLKGTANGKVIGQLVQIKPSWLDTFASKFGSDPAKAPDSEVTPLYQQETSVQAIQHSVSKGTGAVPITPEDVVNSHLQTADEILDNPDTKEILGSNPKAYFTELQTEIASGLKATANQDFSAQAATVEKLNPDDYGSVEEFGQAVKQAVSSVPASAATETGPVNIPSIDHIQQSLATAKAQIGIGSESTPAEKPIVSRETSASQEDESKEAAMNIGYKAGIMPEASRSVYEDAMKKSLASTDDKAAAVEYAKKAVLSGDTGLSERIQNIAKMSDEGAKETALSKELGSKAGHISSGAGYSYKLSPERGLTVNHTLSSEPVAKLSYPELLKEIKTSGSEEGDMREEETEEEKKKKKLDSLSEKVDLKKYTTQEVEIARKIDLAGKVDEAIANKKAIVIDPDELKKLNGNDYSLETARAYSHLGEMQYDYALAVSDNPLVKIISGGPGSGKSEIVQGELAKDFTGIIYDAPNAVTKVVERRIEKAIAADKTTRVYVLLSDPEKAREYALMREIITGRPGPVDYHVNTHMGVVETAKDMVARDVELYVRDARGAQTLQDMMERPWISQTKAILDLMNGVEYNKEDLTTKIQNVKLTEEQQNKAEVSRKIKASEGGKRQGTKEIEPSRESGISRDEGVHGAGGEEVKSSLTPISQATEDGKAGKFWTVSKGVDSGYGSKVKNAFVDLSKLFKGTSSLDFIKERGLLTPEVEKQIEDASEGDDPNLEFKISQDIAEGALKKEGYPGAHWTSEDDLNPTQYQIWDKSIIKEGEAKEDSTSKETPTNVPISRFKTDQELIDFVSANGSGLGARLNITEMRQLAKYLIDQGEDARIIKTWGGRVEAGTVYKPYGYTSDRKLDVVLGKVKGSRGIESMIVAQLNKDKTLDGKFRTHATPVDEKDIVAKLNPDGILKLAEGKPLSENQPVSPTKRDFVNPQAGFISPAKIGEDVGKAAGELKKMFDETQKSIKLSDDLSYNLEKLEGSDQADLQAVAKMVESMPKISARDNTAIFHKAEEALNPKGEKVELTAKQQEIRGKYDEPLRIAIQKLSDEIGKAGVGIPSEGYIQRFKKGIGSPLDKLLTPPSERETRLNTGGLLTQSDSSFKGRNMYALVDEQGNRSVAQIKYNTFRRSARPGDFARVKKVTQFVKKEAKDLGKFNIKAKSVFMKTEVAPVKEKIANVQRKIDALNSIRIKDPVGFAKMGSLKESIDELIHYIDNHVGVFTNEELRPALKSLRAKEATLKTLQGVKGKEQLSNLADKISSLEDSMRELTNQLGDIESKYDEEDLNRKFFKANDGKLYRIQQATAKEIMEHTNIEYHTNAIASRLVQYLRLNRIYRAIQFLESWKERPEFADIAFKIGDGAPPQGYIPTKMPQFRQYLFEPRTAEVLDDFYRSGSQDVGMIDKAWKAANKFFTSLIFYNPIAHPLNVGSAWLVDSGDKLVNPTTYNSSVRTFAKAYTAITKKNEDYVYALQNGAPLMGSSINSKNLAEAIFDKLSGELEKDPDLHDKVMNTLKLPGKFKDAIGKVWHGATWVPNDIFTMQAIYERMEQHPDMTFEDAAKETARFIPDYRLPSRVLGSRSIARIAKSEATPFFALPYHYGVLRSLGSIAKDIAVPKEGFTKDGTQRRLSALAKAGMLALLAAVVYPFLSSLAKKITGNPMTYVSSSGPVKLVTDTYEVITGELDPFQFAQSIIAPTPVAKALPELLFNRDMFTGNPIFGNPPAIGFGSFAASMISPLQTAERDSIEDFVLSFLNIHTPANPEAKFKVESQIYDEEPILMKQVKQDIVNGDTENANAIMSEYNQRLISNYQQALLEESKPPLTQDEVNAVLKKYGMKTPGAKAMASANQLYANGAVTTNRSLISTVVTYAQAIGTDPLTAFNRIFTDQTIRRVDNPGLLNGGAVIVDRMPESASEAVRQQDQTLQSLSDDQMKGLQLDHQLALELGGSNDESNLTLITSEQNETQNPLVENYLSTQLKQGTITENEAQMLVIRYKVGLGEKLLPQWQEKYEKEWGGTPLTADQVKAYVESKSKK